MGAKNTARRFWTVREIQILARLYPDRPTAEVAKALGRSVLATYQCATECGLSKSKEFWEGPESYRIRKGQHVGRCHEFQKGHVPANKGLRRPGYAPGRMGETQFRKGQRTGAAARNWKPVGTILPDPGGYLRIKVREAVHGKEATGFGNSKVWVMYNRYLWEQAHGPIPPDHAVAFKDGDRQHCEIENLECISRAELAHRNRMWGRLPEELARAIQLNGALKRKIRSLGSNGQE